MQICAATIFASIFMISMILSCHLNSSGTSDSSGQLVDRHRAWPDQGKKNAQVINC